MKKGPDFRYEGWVNILMMDGLFGYIMGIR